MTRNYPTEILRNVASIDRRTVKPGQIRPDDIYVGLENIGSDGRFNRLREVEPGALKSNKFRFDGGHVLYGKLRPYLSKIARPNFSGICSTDILPVRPGPALDASFLFHFLRTPAMVEHAASLSTGINLPRLSPRALEDMAIPLPPIEEQRRIAAMLDAADAVRANRRQALARLNTLTQAIFIDMFGDPVANPMGWPTCALPELGQLERGVSKHRPRNDPALLGGPWPLIQTGDVANSGGYIREFTTTYSDLGLAQSKLWPKGTLCITIAANIAKTGVLTFDACFPDSVVGFTSDVDGGSEYVRAFLNFLQPVLERQAPESAQKNINLKVLRSLRAPRPPDSAVRDFAQAVSLANLIAERVGSHSRHLNTLFHSLQHRAFRGDL
jgi:type I restriction enzyme S subunit